jgi:hypothetical protein
MAATDRRLPTMAAYRARCILGEKTNPKTAVGPAGANLLSKGSMRSIMSFASVGSLLSAGSILSIGSVGSIFGLGSSGYSASRAQEEEPTEEP